MTTIIAKMPIMIPFSVCYFDYDDYVTEHMDS